MGILFFALALRLAGIQSRPIWYDEAFTKLFAQQSPASMLESTLTRNTDTSAAEEHPPLYYLGLWGWFQLFGVSISVARIFSIMLSLIVILLIHQIAQTLFDPVTALTAAAFASILPFQIHYAQELRMYSMLTLWLMLATLSYLHAHAGRTKWWGVFAVSAALAQYTHNLAAIYLIPLALSPLFQRDWKTLRFVAASGFFALFLYLPWMLQLPAQFAKVSSSFWVERPGAERFFTLLLYYLPHLPLPGVQLLIGLSLAMIVFALAAFQTFLAWKNKLSSPGNGIWTTYLTFAPALLLWLFSQAVPVYIERALLPAHAVFVIWLAWAFTQTKMPGMIQSIAVLCIATVAILGINQQINYTGFPYGPYEDINVSLQRQMQPGDVIVHSSKLSYLPAHVYSPDLPQAFIMDPPGSAVDTLSADIRKKWNLTEYANIASASENAKRVWLIIFEQSIEEFTAQGRATHPHLEYLQENFSLQTLETRDDLQIYLFIRP